MAEGPKIRVLFFAVARELVKSREEIIQVSCSNITGENLLLEILEHFAVLKPLKYCLVLARNHSYLDLSLEQEIQLEEDDEIAVIPPISSGSEIFIIIKWRHFIFTNDSLFL